MATAAFAAEPCVPATPGISAQAGALNQDQEAILDALDTTKLEQWSLGDKDVVNAACRRGPPDRATIQKWLTDHASEPVAQIPFRGLTFENEDPKLVALLNQLLSKDKALQLDFRERDDLDGCKKAVCVAQKVFGEEIGPALLYMLGKHGFNGSHLSFSNSSAWRADELAPILTALGDLPPPVLANVARNRQLTHFSRGFVKINDPFGSTVADSAISVFDSWNKQSPRHQVSSIMHEIAHVFASQHGLDRSPEWLALSGWKNEGDWKATKPETLVSTYSEESPGEDFAESFVAYRYNPRWLRKRSPEKYRFMKEVVFDGLEFTSDAGCQPSQARSVRDREAINSLLRDPERRPQLGNFNTFFYRCEKAALRELGDADRTLPVSAQTMTDCLGQQVSAKFQARGASKFNYPQLTQAVSAHRAGAGGFDFQPLQAQVDQRMRALKRKLSQTFFDRYAPLFAKFQPGQKEPQWTYCRALGADSSRGGSPDYAKDDEKQALYYPDQSTREAIEVGLRKICLDVLKAKQAPGPLEQTEVESAVERWVKERTP